MLGFGARAEESEQTMDNSHGFDRDSEFRLDAVEWGKFVELINQIKPQGLLLNFTPRKVDVRAVASDGGEYQMAAEVPAGDSPVCFALKCCSKIADSVEKRRSGLTAKLVRLEFRGQKVRELMGELLTLRTPEPKTRREWDLLQELWGLCATAKANTSRRCCPAERS